MRTYRNALSLAALIGALLLGSATSADAQRQRDVRDAVRSLNSKLDDFDSTLRYQMQSASANDGQVDRVSGQLVAMRDAVRKFEDNLDRRRENATDVEQITRAAASIDEFLIQNPQNRRVTDVWQDVRRQVDRLASSYGVTNDWGRTGGTSAGAPARVSQQVPPKTKRNSQWSGNYGGNTGPSPYALKVNLSGTYSLDPQKSESVEEVVSSAGVTGENEEDLKDKLNPPDQIAIDVRGSQITVATSNSAPIVFSADGREQVDNSGGRTVRNRATLTGDKLVVSSLGGESDYTITFTSTRNGQGLSVSRRITTDYLNQTVFVESLYNKTDTVARLGIPAGGINDNDVIAADQTVNDNVPSTNGNTTSSPIGGSTTSTEDSNGGYSDNDQGNVAITNGGSRTNNTSTGTGNRGVSRTYDPGPSPVHVKPGNYIVPDGTMITGRLDNEVNTRYSRDGDRFRMTVQSPNEFRGAVVEGYVSNIQRSGKVTGTASMTLNFERITVRDGQSYDLAGTLRTAADAFGKSAKVDNEGTVRGESQTKNTAKHGGIAAGIGALIGAIAGGGKGALIGAVIGGSGGAGSVAIQDRKDVELGIGSTLTVQAAAPANLVVTDR